MDYAQLNALCADDGQSGQSDQDKQAKHGTDQSSAMELLGKNLKALATKNPRAAMAIESAMARRDVEFVQTDEGIWSATLDGVALASKRKPMEEAKRFAQRFDPIDSACFAVIGFGMGYHCGTLLERLGSCGVVVCFEPDLGLLRAVLEKVDYSEMFSTGRFFLMFDANDPSSLSQMFVGIEAIVGLGIEMIEHPASKARIGDDGSRFGDIFQDVLKATRTHVITTLANSRISFRNALMNLDHYTSSAGIESLKDSCTGCPAVVVSAGPSLGRNLDLLADPVYRASVVVIAVQTVLKQLIARGIKPDFVAALDYHEISKRFYEGLSEEDVRGVRLVVEAKANPAIIDAFPGEVLCVNDTILDDLIGEELAREMGELACGGTVAHLCYYLARYLGCDPVIFIGQDLGFTDGQYYSAGAAIHQVWSGELSAHNTLEMMEWQRIVRMRGLLRTKTDIYGRAIYLDEQMSAYLAQFESDFQKDVSQGLCVIDASEGGVRKQHAMAMTLKEALDQHAKPGGVDVPATLAHRVESADRKAQIEARLGGLIDDAVRIKYLSEQSIGILCSMIGVKDQPEKLNKLILKVQGLGEEVMAMKTAFRMIEAVNQVGVLNRMKRDRTIEMDPDADALGRQQMQVERDITNVEWIRDASQAVIDQLISAREAFLGNIPKQTNNLHDVANDEYSTTQSQDQAGDEHKRHERVDALVMADPMMGGLGNQRSLDEVIVDGMNTLELTIARLDRAQQIDAITIITPDAQAIDKLIAKMDTDKPIEVVQVDPDRFRAHGARVGSARMQSGECWRGSIGMLGVYDEQVEIGLLARVMSDRGIDGCAIVGADWAMIDPELVDETVLRYRHQESEKRIAFSQAVPGIGTMVIDRMTIESLAKNVDQPGAARNHFATLGALVGYIPITPQFDPIAKGMCVEVSPAARDLGIRVIGDSADRQAMLRRAYQSIDGPAIEARGQACIEALRGAAKKLDRACPRTIVLETCSGRLASGQWGLWKRNSIEPIERPVLSIAQAHTVFAQACALRDDVTVVFDGVGDPLMHPDAMGLIQLAKEDGVGCVELRTDLLREGIEAKELLESGVDILSVDLLADTHKTYAMLTGQDRLDQVYGRMQGIFDEMHSEALNRVWFVPRIMRCDVVYGEIEQFFDKWLMLCGSAVIDPLPEHMTDQRIRRLPIPLDRQKQLDRSTMYIQCDGAVVDRNGDPIGQINAFDEGIEQAYQKMLSVMRSVGDGAKVEPKLIGSACSNESAA